MAIETERKFLILRPSDELLLSQTGSRKLDIIQTYLTPDGKTERRIRKITEGERVAYIYTEKRPISGTKSSRHEDERNISEEEYHALMNECISELTKTRFAFPFDGHIIEIDIYPHDIGGDGLYGYAVMEIELTNEDEKFSLPEFIEIKEELTGTGKFSNKAMAKPKRI